MKINIIGAGMAGSIFAKLCRREGIEFHIFDRESPGRASIISENLIGKTWYDKAITNQSLEILRSIVPVREIKSDKFEAYHVYTNDLLEKEYIKADAVPMEGNRTIAYHGGQSADFNGINVICTGAWTSSVTNIIVDASVGHGLAFKTTHPEHIKLYAPFRYEKLIQRNPDEIWFSDSLSVSAKNYGKNAKYFIPRLLERASKFPNLQDGKYWFGYRPILPQGHENIQVPNGWVITGGNKSGMLHYPIQCLELINRLKNQL